MAQVAAQILDPRAGVMAKPRGSVLSSPWEAYQWVVMCVVPAVMLGTQVLGTPHVRKQGTAPQEGACPALLMGTQLARCW